MSEGAAARGHLGRLGRGALALMLVPSLYAIWRTAGLPALAIDLPGLHASHDHTVLLDSTPATHAPTHSSAAQATASRTGPDTKTRARIHAPGAKHMARTTAQLPPNPPNAPPVTTTPPLPAPDRPAPPPAHVPAPPPQPPLAPSASQPPQPPTLAPNPPPGISLPPTLPTVPALPQTPAVPQAPTPPPTPATPPPLAPVQTPIPASEPDAPAIPNGLAAG